MLQSLDRALNMIEYLATQKSVSISELAEKFEVDKSTATRIMQTFAAHDLTKKDPYTQKYSLSNGTLRLSYQVSLNNKITQIAQPYLKRLAEVTKETSRLCGITKQSIYIIDQVNFGNNAFIPNADIPGMSKPLYCSAIGKAALAYLPEDEVREMMKNIEMRRFTENTICSLDVLFAQLEQVRQNGYALNTAEYIDRAFCLAAPVFDEENMPTYAIGISGTTDFRQYPQKFNQITSYIKEACAVVSTEYRKFVKRKTS